MSEQEAPLTADVIEAEPLIEGALVPLGRTHVLGSKRPARKYLTVGDRVFSPVIFKGDNGEGLLHQMSQREMSLVHKFLTTMSVKDAAAEIGVDVETAKRYLKSRRIKAYIDDHLTERAMAAGVTVDYLLSNIKQLIEGTKIMTEMQLEGIKTAARIIRPTTPSAVNVTLNQQNNTTNVNGSGPSPYANMSKDQIMAEMREAVEESAETDE